MQRLSEVDLLCTAVNEIAGAVSQAQTAHNGIMWQVDVPGRGTVPLAGLPISLSRTPPGIRIHPAPIGAATDEVLSSFGFSVETIADARNRRAFG
ncbi:crotonobetainyl-CoA:carnitine CoA-transferase CaiB-like acyl-CoA transferase [Bradyrhizobium sp. GM2.4]